MLTTELARDRAAGPAEQLMKAFPGGGQIVRVHKLQRVATYQFLSRIAEETPGRSACKEDRCIFGDQGNAVRTVLNQGAKALFIHSQPLLGTLSFAPCLFFFERAPHRRG